MTESMAQGSLGDRVLSYVSETYLGSDKPRGTAARQLYEAFCDETPETLQDLVFTLAALVQHGYLTAALEDVSEVKRHPDKPLNEQVRNLAEHFEEVRVYPSPRELAQLVPSGRAADSPFSRRLWLGEAELAPIFFDLEILEDYANDPEIDFQFRYYGGSIQRKAPPGAEAGEAPPVLEHFGLAYLPDGHRCVVVQLGDLARMSPERQRRWKTRLLEQRCKVDRDFYHNEIMGEGAESISIYEALLKEIQVLNRFCEQIGWPRLFLNESFVSTGTAGAFRFPFRPTREAFYRSIEMVDELISQNINENFFQAVLPQREHDAVRARRMSGKSAANDPGALALLSKWLELSFQADDGGSLMRRVLETFLRIRELRQHAMRKGEANPRAKDFFKLHDKMIRASYESLRLLRMALANHPKVNTAEAVPAWLQAGKIREFREYELDDLSF